MVHIKLRSSAQILLLIPRFNRYLSSKNLEIVEQREDKRSNTIDLFIDAHLFGEYQWAQTLARGFFDGAVISVSRESHLQTAEVDQLRTDKKWWGEL